MEKKFDIPFVGLKQGTHEFRFIVGDSFFDSFPFSLIKKGEIHVELMLDKKETILIGNFFIRGFVELDCCRCNEIVKAPIEDEMINYYKFGTENEEDENLIVLPPDEYKINIAQQVYELITVSLPVNPKHKKEDCNEEMVTLINKYRNGSTKKENIDPRWEKLNKLN